MQERVSWKAILFSITFISIALYINYIGGLYTDKSGNAAPGDIILDKFKPVDLSFIYVWLNIAVIAAIFLYPIIFKRDKFCYVTNMVSLFIIVRVLFLISTHLKTPADIILPDYPSIFQKIHFKNDLFFSGHAGLPFLGFLIFKENKKLRYFLLASSLVFGIVVLLMHVHYTIDVTASYFITYGVFKIGEKIFRE